MMKIIARVKVDKIYIYESHLGGLYVDDLVLSNEDLYCEQCGDYNWPIGYATTKAEAWDLLRDHTDIDGSGGYNPEYIQEFIETYWRE
jgi:hypothetical protein